MLKLTKSKDENVRLKALQICLDRGYGKAVQHNRGGDQCL